MSYCLNPSCQQPKNKGNVDVCANCGRTLVLSDRFRATKVIGSGGFGKTYLAVDTDNNPCVIKQFCFPSSSSTALRLFSEEAQRLKTLGSHSQIPTFVDYVEQENQYFIIQEYIDGSNLEEELVADGEFSTSQIEELLLDILPVIEYIHQGGVIHRDIKPENIIRRKSDSAERTLRERKLALVDFSAAKRATETALAKTGTTIGSAGYAAPEQTFGKAVIQSDLYSLGVTCAHLLTNLHPFDLIDSSSGEWVWRDYIKEPVSPKLAQVIDKLLERGPKQRYQSAAEVRQDLCNEAPVKVAESKIKKFSRLEVAIASLIVVGGLGTMSLMTKVFNHPQVATIPQEQVRKAPVPKPVIVPQQTQKSQKEKDLLLTLVNVSEGINSLILILGFLLSLLAIANNDDIRPGISLLIIGFTLGAFINVTSLLFL